MSNPILDEALRLASEGFAVLPLYGVNGEKCACGDENCTSKGKHPHSVLASSGVYSASSDISQITRWFDRDEHLNLGLRTGKEAGLLVIDIDPRHSGHTSLKMLEETYGDLPLTVVQDTGGGGNHFFLKHPDVPATQANLGKDFPGIDIQGDGKLVVVAPSVHVSGNAYEWQIDQELGGDTDVADAPLWLVELAAVDSVRTKISRTVTGEFFQAFQKGEKPPTIKIATRGKFPVGSRNTSLASLAGTLRRQGFDEEPIGNILLEVNRTECEVPLEEKEVLRIAQSIVRYPAGTFAPTDMGNAERYVEKHREDLRYCGPWGRWLVWKDGRWKTDERGRAVSFAKDTARSIQHELPRTPEGKPREALERWARSSESAARIDAMLKLARSDIRVAVVPGDLDESIWLFNLANGTFDLKNDQLLPHDRSDHITKASPAEYDPTAMAPTWDRFLEQILPDEEVRSYVQRAVGYSLTGDVSEQVLFLLWGDGANGKSTFLNAVEDIAGDYGRHAPPQLLMRHQGDSHPTSLASLRGLRFVPVVEIEQGQRYAENLVKQVTGGEPITARYMRQDYFEFLPTFKLWQAVNHLPRVFGTDHGMWRRINLIPFTQTISAHDCDPRLGEKLRTERNGILRWAIEGCREWRTFGLNVPESVQAEVRRYREESDFFMRFIREMTRMVPETFTPTKDIHFALTEWSRANVGQTLSEGEMISRLKALPEFKKHRKSSIRGWKNLELLTG